MNRRGKLAILPALFLLAAGFTLHTATATPCPQSPDQSGAATPMAKTSNQAPAPASPPKAAPSQQNSPANSNGMVWVNTESGVYHKPGSRY
jgi:hypothetical protein